MSMPIVIGVIMDPIEQINIIKDSTWAMILAAQKRGWEVRYPFFTDQFDKASLNEEMQLDRSIDNISGATLSVRAVTKLARVALLLDKAVNAQQES